MRIIVVISFMLLAGIVSAQEMCEVTQPDGTIALVACCVLKIGAEPGEGCDGLAKATSSQEIQTLKSLVREQTARSAAQYLRQNSASSIGYFEIEQPPVLAFIAYCCSCVPNKTCSVDLPSDVCSFPNADGTCPADTIRTICTPGGSGPEHYCTPVD